MKLINHHVHSTGSDGSLTPEQVIKLSIKEKLSFICFTDHYPYKPGYIQWGKDFHSKKYYEQIRRLIQEYKDKIEISFGAEFNWIPDQKDYLKKEMKKRNYDFTLCAVHNLPSKKMKGGLNGSKESFEILLKEYGDIKILVKEYYNQVRLATKSNLFDCIAHLDLIKIFNSGNYFSEDEEWYKKEVLNTLNEIKKNKICIEINTSGFHRTCNEQYPSFWILKEMKKRDIPITISADSHHPEEITFKLKKAYELAKKAGYSSILKFKNRKPIEIKI